MGLSIKREKVIKGFELCHIQGTKCKDCPYNSLPDNENCSETLDRDVLALLKEQEAVPVIQREFAHLLFWGCGSCGAAITHGDKFCRMCGKEMKWDER